MTTNPVSCIWNSEIDLTQLEQLLQTLASNERTVLEGIDYFDNGWARDLPSSTNRRPRSPIDYLRVVAVQDGEYVGFLAGHLLKTDGFVDLAAARNPGRGIGPKLLDTFSAHATSAGRTRLRLMPDAGAGHEKRVRFFHKYGMDWCEDKPMYMCKPLKMIDIENGVN